MIDFMFFVIAVVAKKLGMRCQGMDNNIIFLSSPGKQNKFDFLLFSLPAAHFLIN